MFCRYAKCRKAFATLCRQGKRVIAKLCVCKVKVPFSVKPKAGDSRQALSVHSSLTEKWLCLTLSKEPAVHNSGAVTEQYNSTRYIYYLGMHKHSVL